MTKKHYIVNVTQNQSKQIFTTASSEDLAIKKVNEMYVADEIEFTESDVKRVTFDAHLNPAIHIKN